MASCYYAVCNAGGPISVRLEASTEAEALAAFERLNTRQAIDNAATDAEDDLDIDGSGMSEDAFSDAMEAAGAREVADLDEIHNAHAGTTAHLAGGWMLWRAEVA